MKNFTEFLLAKVNTKQKEYAKSFNYSHLLHLTLMSSSELKKIKKTNKAKKENSKKHDALMLLLDKVEPSIICYFQHARKLFNLIMVKSAGNYEDDKKIISATFKRIPLIDVFFPFIEGKRDFMHYRNSGLNNVLVDLLKQQNIALGIDFSFLLQNRNCIVKLGRIAQNIRFGQKRNVNFCVTFLPASIEQLRDALDVKSLLVCLGMTPGNANKALQFAYSRYVQNKKRKQITKGIIEL